MVRSIMGTRLLRSEGNERGSIMGEFETLLLAQLGQIADKVELVVEEMVAMKARMKWLEDSLASMMEAHAGQSQGGPRGMH